MTEKAFDTFEDELDAIRLSLYEETKDMTPEEEVAYFYAQSEPLLEQYNIKISALTPADLKRRPLVLSE